MTIQQIIWDLDSCDCQILLSYDSDTDTFTPVSFIQTCSFHISFADIVQRHTVVTNENNRKNQAYQLIIDHAPASMLETSPQGGIRLKRGIRINYTVAGTAPDRTFTLIVSGVTLTQNQINTAQTFLDNRFTPGKVTLVNNP